MCASSSPPFRQFEFVRVQTLGPQLETISSQSSAFMCYITAHESVTSGGRIHQPAGQTISPSISFSFFPPFSSFLFDARSAAMTSGSSKKKSRMRTKISGSGFILLSLSDFVGVQKGESFHYPCSTIQMGCTPYERKEAFYDMLRLPWFRIRLATIVSLAGKLDIGGHDPQNPNTIMCGNFFCSSKPRTRASFARRHQLGHTDRAFWIARKSCSDRVDFRRIYKHSCLCLSDFISLSSNLFSCSLVFVSFAEYWLVCCLFFARS